jgi:16S rRNA (adenine1518-N6/adenine1519-N6)-dimethyltransferase
MLAKKSLGQNFLVNKSVLRKIAEAIGINEGDTIVEIGPGHGELTGFMADKSPKRIIAIEKDEKLALSLRQKFGNIQVISGDALKELGKLELPDGWKLAGNIPYYITGHLLRVISELQNPPVKTVIMVQNEVAKRVSSLPPKANLLSLMVRGWAIPEYLFSVPRHDFDPVPGVDSAVISLARKEKPASDGYFHAVRVLFSQPRKKALNNFFDSLGIPKEKARGIFASCGISPDVRPQNISEEEIICLSHNL